MTRPLPTAGDPGDREPSTGPEAPPFGGSWPRIYAAVIVYTVVLIALLYAMTVALNR